MLFSIRSTLLVVLLCSWHTVPENSWNWTSAYAMFFREINLQKRCGNFHDFFVNSILRDYYFALFHDFFRQINFIGTLVFFSWNRFLRHILRSYFFLKSSEWIQIMSIVQGSLKRKKRWVICQTFCLLQSPIGVLLYILQKHFWVLICILFYTKWRNCYTIMQCENYEDLPSSIFYVKSSRNSL